MMMMMMMMMMTWRGIVWKARARAGGAASPAQPSHIPRRGLLERIYFKALVVCGFVAVQHRRKRRFAHRLHKLHVGRTRVRGSKNIRGGTGMSRTQQLQARALVGVLNLGRDRH